MADLLTRPLLRRDEPAWGSRVPWLAAVLGAGWALVAGLALCALPPVAVWIGGGASDPVGDPLRFGGRLWLLAHHVGLDLDGVAFTVTPIGLTVLVLLLVYRSARWAAHSAGVASGRDAAAVIAPATAAYAVGAAAVSAFAGSGGGSASAEPVQVIVWAVLLAGAATALGVSVESELTTSWLGRIAPEVRAALVGAGVAIGGVVAAGAVLVALSAVLNSGRIGELATALDAGALGTVVLALGCAVLVPNAVLWGAAFALGPGFAVGAGTSVAPGGVELGMVPAVPILGALPPEVPAPTWIVVVLPIVAGGLAGATVHRRLRGEGLPLATFALAGVGAGMIAMFVLAVLTFLAAGSAGAARLAEVGAVPGEVALASLALVALPAVVTAVLLAWREVRGPEARTGTPAAH